MVNKKILWLIVFLFLVIIGVILYFLIPGNLKLEDVEKQKSDSDSKNAQLNRDNDSLKMEVITWEQIAESGKKDTQSKVEKAKYISKQESNVKEYKNNIHRINTATAVEKASMGAGLIDEPITNSIEYTDTTDSGKGNGSSIKL